MKITPQLSVCTTSILSSRYNDFHVSVSLVGHFIQVWLSDFHSLARVNNLQMGMLLTKPRKHDGALTGKEKIFHALLSLNGFNSMLGLLQRLHMFEKKKIKAYGKIPRYSGIPVYLTTQKACSSVYATKVIM